MVYLWAVLLLVANLIAWVSTAFGLPGNWLIVLFTALYAYLQPVGQTPHVSWTVVIAILILAAIGEIVEFLAGAAGAAKQGGSRRGIIFSIVGTIVGSILGATVGIPIPVIGPIIGAVGGGAGGAFAGAYLGESSLERTTTERLAIGKGAMIGRLLGTASKLIVGVVMVIAVGFDSFLDLKQPPEPAANIEQNEHPSVGLCLNES
ncbi:DUF456 domain-containing protein [Thalassoroseus pseudoceratinae]|uniref:DUF456 domain-containing protein n=1 Tax=Thalassoroseus pseudoceratinae TaxID=2713176 RepID=UPI001423A8CF|nr:DUF456 domain-containing protein [Thalassoroseus pseudoceratinae]